MNRGYSARLRNRDSVPLLGGPGKRKMLEMRMRMRRGMRWKRGRPLVYPVFGEERRRGRGPMEIGGSALGSAHTYGSLTAFFIKVFMDDWVSPEYTILHDTICGCTSRQNNDHNQCRTLTIISSNSRPHHSRYCVPSFPVRKIKRQDTYEPL